jgi:hypothetical protein
MTNPLHIRSGAHDSFIGSTEKLGTTTLKVIIIVWALVMIGLALYIDNPWILAGMLAWEVLP